MIFDLNYKLNSREKLVGIARKHWFLIVPKLLKAVIIISLLIVFANKFSHSRESFIFGVILIIFFIIYLVYLWILLRVDYFIITDERVIKVNQRGFWNRDLNEISISGISNITLSEEGIAATFLKFGSVKITMENTAIFNMENISNPVRIYQGLIKLKGIKKI